MPNHKSNPEKVFALLRKNKSKRLCDDCVAELAEIKNRIAVNPITSAFGLTSDFLREKDACSRCGKVKLVTQSAH
ncbi:MAG: hypothetical protein H6815_12065 [Phycisphaeraceae bacterium]|nr:hypothetical protein [Phycisphaerales bacterium]MCB9861175.1 hypothetical protein [Phycisphaeraceae bacterium]